MSVYSPEEVQTRLQELAGWQAEDGGVARVFTFSTYADGIAFALKVALLAERTSHHPDLLVGYRRVRVLYVSHDAGGVTDRDFEAALAVSRL